MYETYHGIGMVDSILRENYFPDFEYKGVFLDIGAGDPVNISNSYHFKMNDWQIYAIEPNPRLAEAHRQIGNTTIECAVGKENGEIEYDCYNGDGGWGGNISSVDAIKDEGNYKVITVPLRTLNSILCEEFKDIGQIDLINMDIELYELQALKGFNLEKYKPSVILIEDQNTNMIEPYLNKHGYKLDWRHDPDSIFIPND